jgi:hypothetical protein
MSIARRAAIGALTSIGSIVGTWAAFLALICLIDSAFALKAGEVAERVQGLGVLPYCVAAFMVGGAMTYAGVWLMREETLKSD